MIGVTAGGGEVVAAKVGGVRNSRDVEGGRVEVQRGSVEASRADGAFGCVLFGGSYGEDVVVDREVGAEHGIGLDCVECKRLVLVAVCTILSLPTLSPVKDPLKGHSTVFGTVR